MRTASTWWGGRGHAHHGDDRHTRVVLQVASICLSYPDDDFAARLPLLRGVLSEQPPNDQIARLGAFLDHAERTPLAELQQQYVTVFDFDRKHALHLSYWTDGDTRRRGAVLATFKQRYRDSGWVVDTRGELPDHLPLVLEFSALVDLEAGRELLLAYRAGLELLRLALIDSATPYADLLIVVCSTLPGPSPTDRAAARALAAAGPPTETVGLEPYGFSEPRSVSRASAKPPSDTGHGVSTNGVARHSPLPLIVGKVR